MDHFDVVIGGGGPAGGAAALTLAKLGRRVLLANVGARRRVRAGESFAAAAKPLLADLGVMAAFEQDRHLAAYGNVSLWGTNEPHATASLHELQGCSYQLDRDAFDTMLLDAAKAAGATVSDNSHAALLDARTEGAHEVELSSAGEFAYVSCDWLLDATGRPAALSRRLGARRRRIDRLVAFQARLVPAAHTDCDASPIVEAARLGWWYSTLLPGGERLVCFFTDADLAHDTGLHSATGFMAALEGYLCHCVAGPTAWVLVPRAAARHRCLDSMAGRSRRSPMAGHRRGSGFVRSALGARRRQRATRGNACSARRTCRARR